MSAGLLPYTYIDVPLLVLVGLMDSGSAGSSLAAQIGPQLIV